MELDTLLAPLPGDAPCGEDLSFSPDFDAIQEARRADDPSLDQGEWITDLKTADWPFVAQACQRLLAGSSKDLRLAVWWCEARTRLDGFSGLASGLRLVAGLCEHHWDGLHPASEGDDHEQRVGNLAWLLAAAVRWSREVPLVASTDGRFGLADFEAARARAMQAEREDAPEPDDAPGRPALATLEKARRETPQAFYREVSQALPACIDALGVLERSVDARLGHEGPSFSSLRDALETVHRQVLRFSEEAGVQAGEAGSPGIPASPSLDALGQQAGADGMPGIQFAGPIKNRREALVQLRRVADFFRSTEPHSPVAYLADKAARWGDMPLHVWLRSVVKDEVALSHLNEMLDVAPADDATR